MRRVLAALDATPPRIPVLLGGCGSGRTTLLIQLRDRIGRSTAQYINVDRTATTPERFLDATVAATPFAPGDIARSTTRAAFDATLGFFGRARAGNGDAATFLLDEFLEFRTFESFPGLRRVLHDLLDGLSASGNVSPDQPLHGARAGLLRDRSSRHEVIHAGADRRYRRWPAAGQLSSGDAHEAEYTARTVQALVRYCAPWPTNSSPPRTRRPGDRRRRALAPHPPRPPRRSSARSPRTAAIAPAAGALAILDILAEEEGRTLTGLQKLHARPVNRGTIFWLGTSISVARVTAV